MRVHISTRQTREPQQWRLSWLAIFMGIFLMFLMANGFFFVRYQIGSYLQAQDAEKYKDFVQVAIVPNEQRLAVTALLGKAGVMIIRCDAIRPAHKLFRVRVPPAEAEIARQALAQSTSSHN